MYALSSLTRQRVAELAPNVVVVLPMGSHEQHGNHLPLGTDTMLVEGVAQRAFQGRSDVVLCPTLSYGFSGHHQFASALSIRPETLLSVYSEILDSLIKARFYRILVLNGHGGNIEMMRQSVKLAALHHPIVAASCSYWELLNSSPEVPGHAGRFETDLMSAIHPSLVAPEGTGSAEQPVFNQVTVPGLHIERHGEWARCHGVTDNPGNGDSQRGKVILAEVCQALESCIDTLLATALPPVPVGRGDASDIH